MFVINIFLLLNTNHSTAPATEGNADSASQNQDVHWDRLAKVAVLMMALYPSWRAALGLCLCWRLQRGAEQAQLPVPLADPGVVLGKPLLAWRWGIALELSGVCCGTRDFFVPAASLGEGPASNCLEAALASRLFVHMLVPLGQVYRLLQKQLHKWFWWSH